MVRANCLPVILDAHHKALNIDLWFINSSRSESFTLSAPVYVLTAIPTHACYLQQTLTI